jgi:hypothetical protein
VAAVEATQSTRDALSNASLLSSMELTTRLMGESRLNSLLRSLVNWNCELPTEKLSTVVQSSTTLLQSAGIVKESIMAGILERA